ncbi:MAG: hypothetical protein Q4F21_13810, partial [Lachnospiraceae bacterium]|nr:hypothetical protein [Lachnospiraceae bacterium]
MRYNSFRLLGEPAVQCSLQELYLILTAGSRKKQIPTASFPQKTNSNCSFSQKQTQGLQCIKT